MKIINKIFNAPTTTGGTRIMIIVAILGVLLEVAQNIYPDFFNPDVVLSIEGLMAVIFLGAASREETPKVLEKKK